jgi:multidrug efflux pump subunit AcrB
MIQAEPAFRATPANIGSIFARNASGTMVPLSTLTKVS